jgi:DNA-binding NarL/FixJ family response regulator
MSDIVHILVADDHELIQAGLVSVLAASHPGWHVTPVSNGRQAVEQGIALPADVAILDLSMPELGGLEAAQQLLKAVPGIRIVILSMHAAAPILRQLRTSGVHAYLAKNEAPKNIVHAVERVLAGQPFFASTVTSRPRVEAPDFIPAQFLLTPRELDVLRLLARGMTNKELAGELDMSVRTAESHHANLMAKLGVNSLADLIRIAVRDNIT